MKRFASAAIKDAGVVDARDQRQQRVQATDEFVRAARACFSQRGQGNIVYRRESAFGFSARAANGVALANEQPMARRTFRSARNPRDLSGAMTNIGGIEVVGISKTGGGRA